MDKINTIDKIDANTLIIGDGRCWSHKQKYLGKYLRFQLVGRVYDPDPEYTFENGTVTGLNVKFTEVLLENIKYKI